MKVVGVLSWYQEPPAFLAAAVASFGPHIDHLVAVDGPYQAFDHQGRSRSEVGQVEVIQQTCEAMGIGLTLHQPDAPFFGNEVEKRSLCFRLALSVADPGDWLWVFDGDEVLMKAPADFRSRLHCIERDAIEVTLTQRRGLEEFGDVEQFIELPNDSRSDMRMLFRALPGLRVEGRHDVYLAGHGDRTRVLWAPHGYPGREDAFVMTDVVVDHRNHRRPAHRRSAANDYYKTRDALGLEALPRPVRASEEHEVMA